MHDSYSRDQRHVVTSYGMHGAILRQAPVGSSAVFHHSPRAHSRGRAVAVGSLPKHLHIHLFLGICYSEVQSLYTRPVYPSNLSKRKSDLSCASPDVSIERGIGSGANFGVSHHRRRFVTLSSSATTFQTTQFHYSSSIDTVTPSE